LLDQCLTPEKPSQKAKKGLFRISCTLALLFENNALKKNLSFDVAEKLYIVGVRCAHRQPTLSKFDWGNPVGWC